MKYKQFFWGFLFVIIFLLSGCQKDYGNDFGSSSTTTKVIGEAMRKQYNEIRYFLDNQDYHLNRWDSRMESSEEIIDDEIKNYTILNDKIYYNLSSDLSMWRCDLNGQNMEKLFYNNIYIKNIITYKNYIYYSDNNNEGLYRIDESSKEPTIVINDSISDFHIMNDTIYYKNVTVDNALWIGNPFLDKITPNKKLL